MAAEEPGLRPARIIHQTRTRTRFRIEGVGGDTDYFENVASSLESAPGIGGVVCNSLTSTVLVHHSEQLTAQQLFDLAESRGCFMLAEPFAPVTPIQGLRNLIDAVEQDTRRLSRGSLDTESIALAFLLVAAVSGFLRGDIGFPAATALWYVLELVWKREVPRELDEQPEKSKDD